jgi:hypothetical protein
MAQSEDTFEIRDKVAVFLSYESYLDSLVTDSDRAFLDDDDLARGLVALGLRGSGDVLSREEFDTRKKADRDRHLHKDVLPKPLASMGKDLTGKVLLAALAAREPLVRNGKLTVIVYIRDYNSKGQEVSGYIDLAHRRVHGGAAHLVLVGWWQIGWPPSSVECPVACNCDILFSVC